MGSRIEPLMEKYWNGETSSEEEQMIKDHFKNHPGLSMEARYFRHLSSRKQETFKGTQKKKNPRLAWFSAAATITVGIITAALVINDIKKDPFAIEDPVKALEATRKALLFIGSEINEGQSHTMELTKFNKAKEELENPEEKEEI